ncbi:MAG: plastocyanin/azurin family copper-binding protein [Gemmatimonadales bacterium]
MRKFMAALALLTMACGGGDQAAQDQQPAAAPQAATPVAAATEATGTVHEVKMLQTADGNYQFQPAELSIKVGDTVRWTNVSGFPHNVAFYADKIPQGAADQLASLMPADGKLGPLLGRLLTQAGETFEVSFVNVPTGSYGYFCVPHEALGMTASITVAQ